MTQAPQTLTRQELMEFVRRVRGDRKQEEVAQELGLSQAAVSHAERNPSPSKDRVRIRIVEHYTGYRVRVETEFILEGSSARESGT